MSNKRYPEEFRIEAVKQVTERGHAVAEVAARIGVSQHSLYEWLKRYSVPETERSELQGQAADIRRLKAELKRVSEERDILKRPQRTLPKGPGKVRIHSGARSAISSSSALLHDDGSSERLLRLESRSCVTTPEG